MPKTVDHDECIGHRWILQPADLSLSIDAAGTDGAILTLRIDTPHGAIELMGTIELTETRIVISGCHVEGAGPNSWGPARLRDLGKALLEKLDVAELVMLERLGRQVPIQAAVRTSSGSPVAVVLHGHRNSHTISAARCLGRRHLPVKEAHAVVTRLLAYRFAFVLVPKVEDFERLRQDLADCGIEARLYGPTPEDLKAIRGATRLSGDDFATRYGLDVETVYRWEDGSVEPDAAARTLLWTIALHPDAIEASLSSVSDPEVREAFGA